MVAIGRPSGESRTARDGLAATVAAVLDGDGRPVGTAFLVRRDTLVTCAHVVRYALGLAEDAAMPDTPVPVRFPVTDPATEMDARTVAWPDRPGAPPDVAVLRLDTAPPGHPRPMRLGRVGKSLRYPCLVLGFPAGTPDGAWAEEKVR